MTVPHLAAGRAGRRRTIFPARRRPLPEPIVVTSRYARVGRARLHYLVAGEGPPLVLVHGFSSSTRWWQRNIAALAAHHRVYALDLVGFGRSWPKHHFALDHAQDVVLAWMDALGLAQVDLCGHSMGGYLCMSLAAQHPERVRRLVLVDAAGLPFNTSLPALAWRGMRSSRHTGLGFLPTSVTTTLQAGPLVLLYALRDLLGRDVGATLAQIATPTLIIWGEHDVLVPLALGRLLHAGIRNSRLTIVPGAGHNVMYERADRFNALVLDFLAS